MLSTGGAPDPSDADPDPLVGGVWAVWSPPLPAPAAALPPLPPPPPPPPQAANSMVTATLTISLSLLFTLMSGTMTSCNNCPVLCKRTGPPGLVVDLRRHSLKTERRGNGSRPTSTKVDADCEVVKVNIGPGGRSHDGDDQNPTPHRADENESAAAPEDPQLVDERNVSAGSTSSCRRFSKAALPLAP